MKKIGIVFQKELIDNLRDYRSWTIGLFWSLFAPLLLGGIMMLAGNSIRENLDQPLHLAVSGAENAPTLVGFLKQQDVIVEPAPANPRAAVIAGDLNVVLVIPKAYGDDFSAGKRATLQLVFDSTRQSASPDIQRIQDILDGYGKYMGLLRLSLRGISPQVTRAVLVEAVDTATPQSQAMVFIAMLPYFIIFAIFNGVSLIVIDSTAGERERSSLEPLLINPLSRSSVVIGKMLSAMPFGIFNLLITLVGFAAIFQVLPIEEIIGTQISLDVGALAAIFLICLPIVFLACAIQTLIASFTRTTKEAGTYLAFVSLIPTMPGLLLAFLPVKPSLWTMLIPTFGQQILINQFLRSEPILASNLAISAAITLALATIISFGAIKLYENERIIIG
jgi:sodium transport system permease protein